MPSVATPRALLVAASACGLLALSGCASGPGSSVQGTWDSARPAQAYSKVLVVGLTPNIDSRCRFERVLAGKLNGASTQAVASCDVIDHKAPLTRALVEQAVATHQFDAVISTKLVTKDWAPRGGGSRDTRGSAGYKATDAGLAEGYGYYGGVYSVPVIYGEYQSNAESIVIVGQAQVESKLWSVAGPTLVYSLQTNVKNVESSDEGVSLVASAIASDLKQQRVVQ